MPTDAAIDADAPIPYSLTKAGHYDWPFAKTCACDIRLVGEMWVCVDCGTAYMTLDQFLECLEVR